MANRYLEQFSYGFEKYPVTVNGWFLGTVGADLVLKKPNTTGTGTVTAPTGGWKGIKACTFNATGDYTFKFQDTYQALLGVDINILSVDGATAAPVTGYWIKAVNTAAAGGATVEVFFGKDATPGTGVAFTTNMLLICAFVFSNSSAI